MAWRRTRSFFRALESVGFRKHDVWAALALDPKKTRFDGEPPYFRDAKIERHLQTILSPPLRPLPWSWFLSSFTMTQLDDSMVVGGGGVDLKTALVRLPSRIRPLAKLAPLKSM